MLASAGLLAGRTLTSWPGIRDDVVNAGATWLDEPAVRDRNLVTSRGPQDMVPFVRAVLDHFAGSNAIRSVEPDARTSDPQRDHPPAAVVKTMKWMPRPSLRTAVGLGVVAAAAVAALSRRGSQQQAGRWR